MHRTKSKDKPPEWAASFVGSKLPHNISQCVATGVEVVIDLARAFSSFFETHGAGEILKSLRTGTPLFIYARAGGGVQSLQDFRNG